MSTLARFSARPPDLFADDRTLLGRFADRRDEAAFAALVRRHGGMVLGVCRRAVGDYQLAEDAFQAVFLVLARNPAAATRSASVAGWLFGVARRVGLAARRQQDRRARREQRPPAPRPPDPGPDWDDLLRVLDEELAALPDEYRAPLLACFLRERTQDEAARELGWSVSTLRRRLDRGKELLRARLARRGATLSAGLVAGILAPSAATAGPRLIEDTLRLAGGDAPVSPLVSGLAAAGRGGSAGGLFAAAAGALLLGGLAAGVALTSESPPGPPEVTIPLVAQVTDPQPVRLRVRVTGQVVFPAGRAAPVRRELVPTDRLVKDAAHVFSKGRQFFEDLLVDPNTRGIKNAVVWLRPDDDRDVPFPEKTLWPGARQPNEHVIETGCCQFSPRVVVARAGDRLRFVNRAPVAHTVNFTPAGGRGGNPRAFNVLLPPGGEYVPDHPLAAHPGADHFHCHIHPWMAGAVLTFNHPYVAVTTADGRFSIPAVPSGTWQLVVWHEKTGPTTPKAAEARVVLGDGSCEREDLGPIPLEGIARDERDQGE